MLTLSHSAVLPMTSDVLGPRSDLYQYLCVGNGLLNYTPNLSAASDGNCGKLSPITMTKEEALPQAIK